MKQWYALYVLLCSYDRVGGGGLFPTQINHYTNSFPDVLKENYTNWVIGKLV